MSVAQVRDVALKAGVSPGTVSNALNHPEKVSAATLERVMRAVDELGFVRNDAARQLRAGTNRSVGMIVLDVANPFFTDVARGVEDALASQNRPLLLADSAQDVGREATYLTLFDEQRVSGLLITPTGDVLGRLRKLRERGIAVVIVDRLAGAEEFSSVSVNDRLGGRLATRHLIETGRKNICFVGGPRTLNQVRDRLDAARVEVRKHDGVTLSVHESRTMDAAAGRLATDEFLSWAKRHRPDAVFAANDLVALGVLQALTLAGVRVPDDVAIIGYDDIDFAGSAAIPLSSIRQPSAEMGHKAADLLLAEIAEPDDPDVRHIKLKPELVARTSTLG